MHLSPIADGLPTHKQGTLRRLKESYGGAIEFAPERRAFLERTKDALNFEPTHRAFQKSVWIFGPML